MLRIKENVDLKELEKFGFVFDETTGQYKLIERNFAGKTYIIINCWNRKINYRQDYETDNKCFEILYNLIQAGLVEKVEE